MRRKVIQLARKTFVVSLPSKWVKQQGIKKGDEVDVEDKDSRLVINTKNEAVEQKNIDVSALNTMLGRCIGALYKGGYDEIEVRFETPEQLDIIQKVLMRTCIGLEIVKQGNKYLVAKEISKSEPEEFETVLRRTFLFLMNIAEESLEAMKNKKMNELKKLTFRDDTINRFTDFCRRIINKRRYDKSKGAPLYFIIEELEKIGDNYRDMCRYFREHPMNLTKKIEEIYKETNALLREFYELFYKFDFARVERFGIRKKELTEKIKRALMKAEKEEVMLLLYLDRITESLFDMSGPLMSGAC